MAVKHLYCSKENYQNCRNYNKEYDDSNIKGLLLSICLKCIYFVGIDMYEEKDNGKTRS